MNLLTRETNESIIRHFRVHQYMLYPELIKISMEYLIKFGLLYDPNFYNPKINAVDIQQDYSYHGESYYATDLLTVKLFPPTINKDTLLHAYIPRLIDETFFHVNGSYFVPIFFISDEPIVLKTESISIYSLFQPISLYIKDKRVTFMQDNYEFIDFIQLIIHDWHPRNIELIEDKLGISLNSKRDEIIFNLFGNKLKCDPDPKSIKLKMNQLIFDDWTYELYEKYYGIQPSVDLLIKIAFDKLIDDFQPKFGDLNHKRLTFVEQLMKGFFKHVSTSSKMLSNKKSVRSLMFPQNGFTKHFFTMLDGQSFYDTVNGFSSIISHKATFKNPAASSKLPKSVSELHESHKCRICSNTITNTKPGQMVSLVPDQEIDLRFGIFKENHYIMKHLTR